MLASATATDTAAQTLAENTPQLKVMEVNEPDGQILSYRHLAGSTEVHLRGTKLAPSARIQLKIGSRPGFVELDINRGGISGLKPAQLLGKDFLTYVLWAVSVDGKASNLGEITFEGERPVPVNVTTPYQTFWLMVTAEPNYAVVDPSAQVVLYSARQASRNESAALPIKGDLFYFTHYAAYERAAGGTVDGIPNQLLQARKAVELASKSRVLVADDRRLGLRETDTRARRSRRPGRFWPGPKPVQGQPERPGSCPVREDVGAKRRECARPGDGRGRRASASSIGKRAGGPSHRAGKAQGRQSGGPQAGSVDCRDRRAGAARSRTSAAAAEAAPSHPPTPLVKQPALWFAVSGWAVAVVLLFRRRLGAGRIVAGFIRLLASLLVPGGVLVLASWAVQSEELVRSHAVPYAAFFCFGALIAAVLLSWYYDQCRLLCSASAVLLTVVPLGTMTAGGSIAQSAGVALLPLNLGLFGVLKERGVVSLDGLIKVGIVAAQAAGVYWIAEFNAHDCGATAPLELGWVCS